MENVTHGKVIEWKRSVFQAHAAPARSIADVEAVVNAMLAEPEFSSCCFCPFAYRVRVATSDRAVPTVIGIAQERYLHALEEKRAAGSTAASDGEPTADNHFFLEGFEDSGEAG